MVAVSVDLIEERLPAGYVQVCPEFDSQTVIAASKYLNIQTTVSRLQRLTYEKALQKGFK